MTITDLLSEFVRDAAAIGTPNHQYAYILTDELDDEADRVHMRTFTQRGLWPYCLPPRPAYLWVGCNLLPSLSLDSVKPCNVVPNTVFPRYNTSNLCDTPLEALQLICEASRGVSQYETCGLCGTWQDARAERARLAMSSTSVKRCKYCSAALIHGKWYSRDEFFHLQLMPYRPKYLTGVLHPMWR